MAASKGKLHPPQPSKLLLSPFAEMALKAMRRAQRIAARENARYGLPLILEKVGKGVPKRKSGGGNGVGRRVG